MSTLSPTDFTFEMQWLSKLIKQRIEQPENVLDQSQPLPELSKESAYANFIVEHQLAVSERVLLALALAPHILPSLLHQLVLPENKAHVITTSRTTPLPTGETVLWLLAGHNPFERVKYHHLFDPEHVFFKAAVISIGGNETGDSIYAGVLSINRTFRDLFIYNEKRAPRFSTDFPAKKVDISLTWDDLILNANTQKQLSKAKMMLKHHREMRKMGKIARHLSPGCCILLHGDSGLGKTLTARLFGQLIGRDVYELAIEGTTSKWVGETMQRMESFFAQADQNDWVVVVNEADSLFGKRGDSGAGESTNSRYADQDVSYLIQRMETFRGVLVLTTNMRTNLDRAFQRRFDCAVQFMPLAADQLAHIFNETWEHDLFKLDANINWKNLFLNYPISPAALINVIKTATAVVMENSEVICDMQLLEQLVKDEHIKYLGQKSFSV